MKGATIITINDAFVKQVCNELHIDQIDEELATLTNLLTASQAQIDNSIELSIYPDIVKSPLYDRAIITLAQAIYYDRNLISGQPKAVIMMVDHLNAICLTEGGTLDGSK
ncbi:head-tail connector protein [Lactiplantibacillus plantarum]|uniref:head-tail connector protein n=1 Tax=Lactiplantibacillus plantarum TaxID=1590 RepID=UPI003F65F716